MSSPSLVDAPLNGARGVEADLLAARWEWALDAAARAAEAGRSEHIGDTVRAHERELLTRERRDVTDLLERLAASRGHAGDGWLPPRPVTPHMLGLPPSTTAVVLDLDGVLTDSDALHAAAWADALDPVLLQLSHTLGWGFVPFDPDAEYRLYFDGRPRLEGIRLFLASRGLRLPEDEPAGSGAPSVAAIARRKSDLVEGRLHARRLEALPGARRYLQAAAHARIPSAVVSASESTRSMLELARLDHLVGVVIDAEAMRIRGLSSRPSPDPLVAACTALAVHPAETVSLTHSGAGVVAALHAGMAVRGVAHGTQSDRLRGFGAEIIVASLLDLLDASIRPPATRRAPSLR